MLPKEAVTEYQEIYKKVYGKDISFSDAQQEATDLLQTVKAVYKPIKKEWIKEVKQKYE